MHWSKSSMRGIRESIACKIVLYRNSRGEFNQAQNNELYAIEEVRRFHDDYYTMFYPMIRKSSNTSVIHFHVCISTWRYEAEIQMAIWN